MTIRYTLAAVPLVAAFLVPPAAMADGYDGHDGYGHHGGDRDHGSHDHNRGDCPERDRNRPHGPRERPPVPTSNPRPAPSTQTQQQTQNVTNNITNNITVAAPATGATGATGSQGESGTSGNSTPNCVFPRASARLRLPGRFQRVVGQSVRVVIAGDVQRPVVRSRGGRAVIRVRTRGIPCGTYPLVVRARHQAGRPVRVRTAIRIWTLRRSGRIVRENVGGPGWRIGNQP